MIAARLPFADAIRKGIADYNRQGFECRMSTPDEVREQCKAFDDKHKMPKWEPKVSSKRRRGKSYTDETRNAVISIIHDSMSEGHTTKESCVIAGVGYRLYMQWRTRFKITSPKCQGKSGPKKGAK